MSDSPGSTDSIVQGSDWVLGYFLAATQLLQDRPRAEVDQALFHIFVYGVRVGQTFYMPVRRRLFNGFTVSFPQYNGKRVVEDQEGAHK